VVADAPSADTAYYVQGVEEVAGVVEVGRVLTVVHLPLLVASSYVQLDLMMQRVQVPTALLPVALNVRMVHLACLVATMTLQLQMVVRTPHPVVVSGVPLIVPLLVLPHPLVHLVLHVGRVRAAAGRHTGRHTAHTRVNEAQNIGWVQSSAV
jgi:hypothetical protein